MFLLLKKINYYAILQKKIFFYENTFIVSFVELCMLTKKDFGKKIKKSQK
jgi:hypothetical protein